MDSDTAVDSSTARGLLMLRPIPTTPTADSDTTAMDSDTTARGLLMLSLRLRLILTTDTVLDTDMALDTPDTSDTPDTVDTTTASRLYQDLSVSLGKNGLLSVCSFHHQCCSFSATILSLW